MTGPGSEAAGVAALNRAALLRCMVSRGEPVAVSEFCRETGLSRPTVTSGLRTLMDRGWVREETGTRSTPHGGRPGRRYGVAGESFLIVGVILRRDRIETYAADLDQRILAEHTSEDVKWARHRHPVQAVWETVDALLADPALEGMTPTIIVAAVLGIVRDQRNIVQSGAFPELKGERLHTALEGRYHCPVIIENDANLAAFAEARTDGGPGTIVGLLLGPDVGCGIVIDGRVHHGWHGAAGELHYSGWSKVWGRMQEAEEQGLATATLFRMAGEGDRESVRFVSQLARNLSAGLAAVIEVLDPRVVIIGGEAVAAGAAIEEPLQRYADRHLEWETNIVLSSLGPRPLRRGALLLGQEAIHTELLSGAERLEGLAAVGRSATHTVRP